MVLRDSDSVLSAGGTTVRAAEMVTRPNVAEIVTVVGCETTGGTMLKVRYLMSCSTTQRRRHRRHRRIAADAS